MREVSPVGDSKSNSFIERNIQAVQGQTKTLRSAVESRIDAMVSPSNRFFPNRSLLLRVLMVNQRGDRTHTTREAASTVSRPGIAVALSKKHHKTTQRKKHRKTIHIVILFFFLGRANLRCIILWTNTMSKLNEPIQGIGTMNQYNEPIQ